MLIYLGLLTLFWPLIKLALIFVSLALPPTDFKKYGAGQGAWVIVTGSTGAIGAEWAKQLAAKGFNILLVSRNNDKLKAQAEKVRQEVSGVKIDHYAIDMGAADEQAWDAFQRRIADLKIGILLNNAGTAESVPIPFTANDWSSHESVIRLNVLGTAKMTHIVSKQLVKARKGAIVNVSSFTGYAPAPNISMYSASKAWLHSFSSVLGHELRVRNIDVICLQAHFVVSTINGMNKPSFLIPSPKDYVDSVVRRFGNKGGALFEPPYVADLHFSHALEHWFVSTFAPWRATLYGEEKTFNDMFKKSIKDGTRKADEAKKLE